MNDDAGVRKTVKGREQRLRRVHGGVSVGEHLCKDGKETDFSQ